LTSNQTINLIGDNTGSGSAGNISTTTVGLQAAPWPTLHRPPLAMC
jgi:hypothetical protein